eukprot:3113173-Rhodomonas_salina.3
MELPERGLPRDPLRQAWLSQQALTSLVQTPKPLRRPQYKRLSPYAVPSTDLVYSAAPSLALRRLWY